jgi:hypothetical protein
MMLAAKEESEGRHNTTGDDSLAVAGSQDTAHQVLLDIEAFIYCNLRFKKCFLGHSSIVLAVMMRYPSCYRIQATGCLIIDQLAMNVALRLELDSAGAADVLMQLMRGPLLQLSHPGRTPSECNEEKSKRVGMASLIEHVCKAVSSLLLDCPSSASSFHAGGIAGCIVDLFNAHFCSVVGRRQHPEAAQVVFHVMNLVSILAGYHGGARDLLAELGMCAMVEEAAREYEDDEQMLMQVFGIVLVLFARTSFSSLFFVTLTLSAGHVLPGYAARGQCRQPGVLQVCEKALLVCDEASDAKEARWFVHCK